MDSLCFNQDRHSGNYGVLLNNNTMQIVGMSPVFDLNISMLPYVGMSEFENIGDKLFSYAPKLGKDFTRIGQIAMNDAIRDRLKDIADFSFSFRGDSKFTEKRIKLMEDIVQKQAAEAVTLMNEFDVRIEDLSFEGNSFISVCDGTDAVQLCLENESYLLTVDFLKKKVFVQQNAQAITMQKLKTDAPDFYMDAEAVIAELAAFLNEKGIEAFC